MDGSNNFATYASKLLASRLMGASSEHSPIFHAGHDDASPNRGPWMNDDEIEDEMAHLQQSTLNRSTTSTSQSRSTTPHEHLDKSPPSQRVSTPDISHMNQAQSLFTNASALSFHKPPSPEPEAHEEYELQLSQPLLYQSDNHHSDDDEEQPPQQLFLQAPAPTPTAPPLTCTPIRKYRDAPFLAMFGFSIILVVAIGLHALFRSSSVGLLYITSLHSP